MPCTTEDLYRSFRSRLKRFISSKIHDDELAKDLVQEAFVKITHFCQCGGDCTHPKSFLYKIAMNMVADHFRKSNATIAKIDELPELAEDEADLNKEFVECLVPLISNLPEPYREAVRLADIEQIPQQEIARRMNISLSGAKSRVQRGREKLRSMIVTMCEIEHDRYGNITSCEPRS